MSYLKRKIGINRESDEIYYGQPSKGSDVY
jgi:hypothetical protein